MHHRVMKGHNVFPLDDLCGGGGFVMKKGALHKLVTNDVAICYRERQGFQTSYI
jgi:hypothetical protein